MRERLRSSLNHIWIVFSKEVSDNLRDYRSLASALAGSVIGPVLMLVMIIVIGKSLFTEEVEKPLMLPVIGAEYAPDLITFLENRNVQIVAAPANPQEAVRNGDVNLVIEILPNYATQFAAGQPAKVRLILDTSRQSSLADINRIYSMLEGYNEFMGSLRLMVRGISADVIKPLAVERVDLATPQTQSLMFLNTMPYFVIMVIFVGGAYVVVDTTAGERERGSLEPLLIAPLARWEFAIGKLLSSIPFAFGALLVNLAAFGLVFNAFPLENFLGFQLSIDPSALVWIVLLSLPMILLAAALQMVISTFSRSVKEAQTYTGFLPLIPALPGIGLAFLPVKANLWTMLVPTFGQQILINQFMRAEAVSPQNFLVSALSTTLLALLLAVAAVRMFEQERLVFGAR